MPVPGYLHVWFTVQADAYLSLIKFSAPVLSEGIPGFFPGLPGGLLFFRPHGRFLFINAKGNVADSIISNRQVNLKVFSVMTSTPLWLVMGSREGAFSQRGFCS